MDELATATGGDSTNEDKTLHARIVASPPKHFATAGFSLSRRNVKITRRHSSMVTASRPVDAIPEASGEDDPVSRKRLLRRSTTRLVLGESRTPMTFGLRRAGSVNDDKDMNGSPYEDMVERFQIRQLQRSPSTRTAQTDDKRSSFTSSRVQDDDLNSSEEDRSGLDQNPPKHQIQRKLSSLQSGNNISLTGEGDRLHSSDNSANINGNSVEELQNWGAAFEAAFAKLRTWRYRLLAPISPFSRLSQARYVMVLLVTVTYVLWLPLELAFPDQHSLTDVKVVIGILLSIDVMLTLHTGYTTPIGTVVISHWSILWNYIKTRLVLDVLLVISLFLPINPRDDESRWLSFLFGGLSAARLAYILRFIRMMWLIRSNQNGGANALWTWLQYSRYSHLIRIAAIIVALLVIAHYIACVWTVLLEKSDPFYQDDDFWGDQYAASFYSALTLLQGNAVPTATGSQNVFASLSVLVGSIVFAVVFGHVAVLVSNFNANTTDYQRKMEEVYAMTKKLQLPSSLRRRIHEYYEHLWHEYECIDGDIVQFSKELSHTLGLEIALFKYMDLVMTVPFWKDCSADFQKQLMLRLDVRVYLPNDFIMREGEVDDEFYMVNRGYCELVRDLDKFERVTNTILGRQQTRTSFSIGRVRRNSGLNVRVGRINESFHHSPYELDPAQRQNYSSTGRHVANQYGVLVSKGQVFGDLALVMNYPRAANVRAITHVEMCILSRKDFQDVLARYPDDRRRIVIEMLTSYMQSYELSQSHCPLLDMVRSVYSPEAIKNAFAKAGGTPPLIPPILTARQAAERIYTAINVEMIDSTIKFGVGVDIREQLIQLRERRRELKEAAAKQNVDGKPSTIDESTKTNEDSPNPIGDTRIATVKMEAPGNLQIRLQQALDRETAIFKSLQDLKANLEGPLRLRGMQNSKEQVHPHVNSTSLPCVAQQAVPVHQQQRSGEFTAETPQGTSYLHVEQAKTQTSSSVQLPESNSSPMSGLGSSENPRVRLHPRKLTRRSQSQKLKSLTEDTSAKHTYKSRASIGSSSTPSGPLYRLRSPTSMDATKSPTYYADALFRPR